MLPEQLELELADDDWRALGRDGAFAVVPVPVEHASDGGRYRLQVWGFDPPRMRLTDEIPVPPGHRLSSLAMSPGGALACVLDAVEGDRARLVGARQGRRAQVALPASARVRWRADG